MNWNWLRRLYGTGKPAIGEAGMAITTTEYSRCLSFRGDDTSGEILSYRRHLYLGAEFCKRGCGRRNPDFKAEVSA